MKHAMKRSLIIIIISLLPVFSFCAEKADAIMGVWLTEIADAKIEIYRSSGKYYGKVVWMAEPLNKEGKPQLDEHNPNEKKRTQPIMNMDILVGFVYDNDGEWDGVIYDPKDGESYTCKLWVEDGNLKVRGYSGWLYKTKTWTKV